MLGEESVEGMREKEMGPRSLALVWWEDLALVNTGTPRKALPCAFQQKLSSETFLFRVSVVLNIFND